MSKEIVIDAGSGFNPMVRELRENIIGSGILVCVDSDLGSAQFAGRMNCLPLCAYAQKLPFRGNSVSLILAKDFVGYPGRIDRWQGLVKANFSIYDLMKEWKRVIKRGGRLVIVETATPPDVGFVKDVFVKGGFRLEEENYGELAYRVFKWGERVKAPEDAYSLVFRKR